MVSQFSSTYNTQFGKVLNLRASGSEFNRANGLWEACWNSVAQPQQGVMLFWAKSYGVTTVCFLLLQVTGQQGHLQGNKLPQLHVPKTAATPSLAGRSLLRVAQGQGLPARSRWNVEAVSGDLGDRNRARWRGRPRGGRRTGGLPSRRREHLQRKKRRL